MEFCMKDFFFCPPHKNWAKFLTVIFCFCSIGLFLYSIDENNFLLRNCTKNQNNSASRPITCEGGNNLGLFILYVSASFGGVLMSWIKLPPLLGMLIMGFLLRNVPYINIVANISKNWSGNLRNMALMIILIRAGLGLDAKVLKKLSFVVVRLACVPCLVEAVVEAIVSRFLIGLPWGWAFMLGFILAAVSPAVVVPSVLELEKKGYGVDQGVNTLVIAAASIDDVLAITGFGIALGFSFSVSDNLVLNIFRGPLDALAGIAFGLLFGWILWFLPSLDNVENLVFYRTVMLYALALVAMFGSSAFKVPGAGALGVLVLAFFSGFGWRRRTENWIGNRNSITKNTDVLWWLFQPFLFGLIGIGLDIHSINFNAVGFGIVTLIVGIIFRLLASFLAVCRTHFSMKERLFIPIAWLPKATVQAALGPVALDLAIKEGFPQNVIDQGEILLAIAAISIILTAPIGAALISLLAPILLKKSEVYSENADAMELTSNTKIITAVSSADEEGNL